MYGNLKQFLHLSADGDYPTLLEVCGVSTVVLRPILKPILAKWEWEIEAYVATMKLEGIAPVLPFKLLEDVTHWVDAFEEYTIIKKAMVWYFICDSLAHISNEYLDQRVHEDFLKQMGISDLRNNSITILNEREDEYFP